MTAYRSLRERSQLLGPDSLLVGLLVPMEYRFEKPASDVERPVRIRDLDIYGNG